MSEDAQLLHLPVQQFSRRNHYFTRSCVSSNSARVVLFLNVSVLMIYNIIFNSIKGFQTSSTLIIVSIAMCIVSILSVLAGLLTDIKFGRYKTILYTFFILPIEFILLPLPTTAVGYVLSSHKVSVYYLIVLLLGTLYAVVFLGTIVVFITNAIQFGMDQLHDCSTQDSILYIHWYVWINYFTAVVGTLPWSFFLYDYWNIGYYDGLRITGAVLACFIFLCIMLMLILSLYFVRFKKSWLLIELVRVNPYKLLYRVIGFAWRHKIPVYRSAFTYCEDEIPTRLDLGKTKYGGPFTTEQVEDVKAFLGILKILLLVGPVFMLQYAQELALLAFSEHGIWILQNDTGFYHMIHPEGIPQYVILSRGLLSPLLVVICIPLYLRLIRPHILYHIPGIMKRIGMGILLMILSLCCAFAMDIVVHLKDRSIKCMLRTYTHAYITDGNANHHQIYQNIYYFIAQSVLIALSNMTFDIAVLEFIASQSPYFMKGLLFGVFFAVRSLLQATALFSVILFGSFWKIAPLSCGSGFYLMNITVGLAVFMMYVCVAKRYKYRERDEPSHIHRYAEEYYSTNYGD